MIVRQFINWIRTAPAGERAEATRALARAWLISDLSHDDRVAAEGALLMLLDDASPLVRQAMAEAFARSTDAPASIVRALSADQPTVALPVMLLFAVSVAVTESFPAVTSVTPFEKVCTPLSPATNV